MLVAVGSTNPVKIEAVRLAFKRVWPQRRWSVQGVDVASGVSKQPMSDGVAIRGARNRAKAAMEKRRAFYGVGIEGGMQKIGNHWFDCGWTVVVDRDGQEGIGSSLRLMVPPSMVASIKAGKELGEVIDNQRGSNAHVRLC